MTSKLPRAREGTGVAAPVTPASRAAAITSGRPTSSASLTAAVFTDSSITLRTEISPNSFCSKFVGVHRPSRVSTETGSPEIRLASVISPLPLTACFMAARSTNGLNALPGWRLASTARLNWVSP